MNPNISKLHSSKLDENFNNLDLKYCDPTNIYMKFELIIISTASEILGKYRRKKYPWITDNILDLCDERRSLKSKKK